MNGTLASHDLIVVGAGIVGASCADAAAAEGLRVAIVEPGPIGGGATAADVAQLAGYVQTRVESEFGVRLQPEPVLVGLEL